MYLQQLAKVAPEKVGKKRVWLEAAVALLLLYAPLMYYIVYELWLSGSAWKEDSVLDTIDMEHIVNIYAYSYFFPAGCLGFND
ncbi:hypothetical protein V6N11_075566 [Hibiscus sabdariffa]|uniref:Uncharacterized protein n=1 Tax=Hibiscus sabdariffa TaxID=183260 RepID=A0ABR2R6V9_9ROSI